MCAFNCARTDVHKLSDHQVQGDATFKEINDLDRPYEGGVENAQRLPDINQFAEAAGMKKKEDPNAGKPLEPLPEIPGMPMTTDQAYDFLGVKKEDYGNLDKVKMRFRKMSLKWHPDKNMTREKEAGEVFMAVHAAYHFLTTNNFDYKRWYAPPRRATPRASPRRRARARARALSHGACVQRARARTKGRLGAAGTLGRVPTGTDGARARVVTVVWPPTLTRGHGVDACVSVPLRLLDRADNFVIPPMQSLEDVLVMALKGADPYQIEMLLKKRGDYRPHQEFGINLSIPWNAGPRAPPPHTLDCRPAHSSARSTSTHPGLPARTQQRTLHLRTP